MKVVAFNGSPSPDGNTAILLMKVLSPIARAGIDTELERLQAVLRGERWEGARDEAARLSRFAGQVGAIRTGALLAKIADSVSRGRRSQALEEFEGLAPRLVAFRRRVAARD